MLTIKIVKDFTDAPGPRFINEGLFSGEEFRDKILIPKYKEAKKKEEKLLIDFDGGFGYPTSFLEEAFGGCIRSIKDKAFLDIIKFKSEEDPTLISEVIMYIKKAIEELK